MGYTTKTVHLRDGLTQKEALGLLFYTFYRILLIVAVFVFVVITSF